MADLQEYKCPSCGGGISFDSISQKMKCPFCDTEFDIEALKSYDAEVENEQASKMDWDVKGEKWSEEEAANMALYSCQSCGGEIICDINTAAAKCPYCDNPIVMKANISGDLRPDFVIPFKLDKNQAKMAMQNHLTGKKFLPKVFKSENHIDEIKGIYVPFWMFSGDIEASILYKGTRVKRWSDSSYIYTQTSYYKILREGGLGFDLLPVDASSKLDDDLMESVEPYDFSQAVDFQSAYLAGYLADKYDVTSQQSIPRANQRFAKSTADAFRSTIQGFNTVFPEHTAMQLLNSTVKYALLPVWTLNTTWRDKKYTFAMNGQTGKFVGNLPLDLGAFFKWFALLAIIIGSVAFGILMLIQLFL